MSASNPFVKGGRYGHLIENIIQSNAWPARESALKLYTKICQNILNNPTEPKFRKINVEKVIAKFGTDFKGIAELLKQVGFIADGVWSDREAKSAAGRAEAERIRQENMKEVASLRAAKDANRAQVKSLAAQARQDVADKPIVASKGTEIKFGSTIVKAPPPPPPAKGG